MWVLKWRFYFLPPYVEFYHTSTILLCGRLHKLFQHSQHVFRWPWWSAALAHTIASGLTMPQLSAQVLPPMLCCHQAAAAAAVAFVLIIVVVVVIAAISIAITAAAFSWLLIVVCAPTIVVAAGVFIATAAALPIIPSYRRFCWQCPVSKIQLVS